MNYDDDEFNQWDDECLCPCCLEDSVGYGEDYFHDDDEVFGSILTFEDEQ